MTQERGIVVQQTKTRGQCNGEVSALLEGRIQLRTQGPAAAISLDHAPVNHAVLTGYTSIPQRHLLIQSGHAYIATQLPTVHVLCMCGCLQNQRPRELLATVSANYLARKLKFRCTKVNRILFFVFNREKKVHNTLVLKYSIEVINRERQVQDQPAFRNFILTMLFHS